MHHWNCEGEVGGSLVGRPGKVCSIFFFFFSQPAGVLDVFFFNVFSVRAGYRATILATEPVARTRSIPQTSGTVSITTRALGQSRNSSLMLLLRTICSHISSSVDPDQSK